MRRRRSSKRGKDNCKTERRKICKRSSRLASTTKSWSRFSKKKSDDIYIHPIINFITNPYVKPKQANLRNMPNPPKIISTSGMHVVRGKFDSLSFVYRPVA